MSSETPFVPLVDAPRNTSFSARVFRHRWYLTSFAIILFIAIIICIFAFPRPSSHDNHGLTIITEIKSIVPAVGEGIRLAVYQGQGPSGTIEAIEYLLNQLEDAVKRAKEYNAHIISFPELYLTGYAVEPDSAHVLAMNTNSEYLQRVASIAKKNSIGIICPYPEKALVNNQTRYYDAIAVFDENGVLAKNYRKTHLWGPDEKKIYNFGYEFPEEGEPFTTFMINGFPVAVLNCYEAEFAELSRILALKGAKLIVIPTAADVSTLLSTGKWTTTPYPDITRNLIPAHCYESNIFISYSNRCCEETLNGKVVGKYRGNSMVADPHGRLLIAASNRETLLISDCVPADFGPTHPENTDYLSDRRPELYSELVKAK